MIQDDRIAEILGRKLDLLQETLRSHRAAVSLDAENTDALFNTGQVLTSLAEELVEAGGFDSHQQAKDLLKEASDIFTKCLLSQQQEYEQIQREMSKAEAANDSSELMGELTLSEPTQPEVMDTSSAASDNAGEWATIVEPLTPEVLLETCTALLGALSSLIVETHDYNFADIQSRLEQGNETVNNRIPLFIKYMEANPSPKRAEEEPTTGPTLSLSSSPTQQAETSPKVDALIAAANFRVSLLHAGYRIEPTKTLEYAQKIEQIFAPLVSGADEAQSLDIDQINVLSAYADALFEFATAVSQVHAHQSFGDTSLPVENLETQWTALSQAQKILTKLSTSPVHKSLSPSRLADVFSARGDVDLHRFHVASSSSAKPAWAKSRPALASNAGAFYRAARAYAQNAGAAEVFKTVDGKSDVAYILWVHDIPIESRPQSIEYERLKGRQEEAMRAAQTMCEDGVIGSEQRDVVMGFYG